MAINLSDNLQINVAKPADNKYFEPTNNRPFTGVSEVNSTILENVRHVGLTVNVDNQEYWYATGTTDSDLVLKTAGGGGGSSLTFNNGLTETGGTVSLGGTLTGDTVIDSNIYSFIIDGGTISGGLTLLRADIGSSINEPLIRFKNETGNNVASGFVDINIGTCNINQSSEAWGNIAIGQNNLSDINATGDFAGGRNIAIGYNVGSSLTTSNNNVLAGRNVLQSATIDSSYNVIAGYGTSQFMHCGKSNAILGLFAARNISGGVNGYNTIIGSNAAENVTTMGSSNSIIGTSAIRCASNIQNNNVIIGNSAAYEANTPNGSNVFIGVQSGREACNTTEDIAIGLSASRFTQNSTASVAIGRCAGFSNGGCRNLFIGFRAGVPSNSTLNNVGTRITGTSNTFIGSNSTFDIATPSISQTIVIANDFEASESNKLYLASKGDVDIISTHDGVSAQTSMTQSGLYYDADYSATGGTNPRWIPDVDFITGLTSNNSLTFNNGLTETGGTVSLGGNLTGNTTVDMAGFAMKFGKINPSYASTGSSSFAAGYYSSARGAHAIALGRGAKADGDYSMAFGFYSYSYGQTSVALGSGFVCGDDAFAVGVSSACGCMSFSGNRSISIADYSSSFGYRTRSFGNYSFVGGYGSRVVSNTTRPLIACGRAAFNFSTNTNSQVCNGGSNAESSAILGGLNHNIESGNTNAAIIGGNTINLTGTTYIDTTAVSKLAIMDSPANGTSGDTVLVRDSSTGIIKEIAQSGLTGGGGSSLTFNNGLTDNGGTVSLGGTLTGNTSIDSDYNGFSIGGYSACATGTKSIALNGKSYGYNSISIGNLTQTCGDSNIAIGIGNFGDRFLYACGYSSINISRNNTNQTSYHGALADQSTILGGLNHNIEAGNTNATIIGGNAIKLTGTTYIDTTVVGKFAIFSGLTSGSSGDNILVRDSSNGIIKEITNVPVSNGLTGNGSYIGLGGSLTGNTNISTTNNYSLGIGYCVSTTGGYSFAFGSYVCTLASGSVALNTLSEAHGLNSMAISGGKAYGSSSFAAGSSTCANGSTSFAIGTNTLAAGSTSFAGGTSTTSLGRKLLSCGFNSFNFSESTSSQTVGHGALANNSAILGGVDHNIESGNTKAAIIGGNAIKLTGTTYIDTTAVSKLAIMDTPDNGTSGDTVLVRDSSTGIIKEIAQSSIGGSGGDLNNVLDVSGVTSVTASTNTHVLLVDTSGGTQTITLPASPLDGQSYKIKDKGNGLANNITIDGNGVNIDDSLTATINTNYGALELVYDETEGQWYTLSFIN